MNKITDEFQFFDKRYFEMVKSGLDNRYPATIELTIVGHGERDALPCINYEMFSGDDQKLKYIDLI